MLPKLKRNKELYNICHNIPNPPIFQPIRHFKLCVILRTAISQYHQHPEPCDVPRPLNIDCVFCCSFVHYPAYSHWRLGIYGNHYVHISQAMRYLKLADFQNKATLQNIWCHKQEASIFPAALGVPAKQEKQKPARFCKRDAKLGASAGS